MDVNILKNIVEYLAKAFSGIKPILGAISGFVVYVCFPTERIY